MKNKNPVAELKQKILKTEITTKQMLTQKDKINVKLIKQIMTERKRLHYHLLGTKSRKS